MTRKRFIKLLMAQGQRRNEAQAIAFSYNARNIPYAKALKMWGLEFSMSSAFKNLSKVAVKMGRAFIECTRLMKSIGGAENG